MAMIEDSDVGTLIRQAYADGLPPSTPGGWYSQEGDCLFYYAEDESYYAVRLTDRITVFEAYEDDRPVGIQLKGIKSLLKELPALDYMIQVEIAKQTDFALDYLVRYVFALSKLPPDIPEQVLEKTLSSSQSWRLPRRVLEEASA